MMGDCDGKSIYFGLKTITLSANTSWYLFNFRGSTIRTFLDHGYRVVCLSPPDEYSARLHEIGCKWLPLPMDNKGANPVDDALMIIRLWRYYRSLRPCVAFHFTIKNNIYGTWAAKALGIPAINNVSGLGTAFIHNSPVSLVIRLLYRLSQPMAYRVYCQNDEDYSFLAESGLVSPCKLALLPGSGVDVQRFHPGLRVEHYGPFCFLYAGRMLADKGLHELIAAISQINADGERCNLWLCGFAGSDNVSAIPLATLKSWNTLPGVRFLGASDHMEKVYAQVDAVVLPSYREGMPRCLLEAGAMGLPVVATNVPGCRNIVTDGLNGLLCNASDVDSLYDALEKMLSLSNEDRERMGAAGRQRVVDEYDEQLVISAALVGIESAIAALRSSSERRRDWFENIRKRFVKL